MSGHKIKTVLPTAATPSPTLAQATVVKDVLTTEAGLNCGKPEKLSEIPGDAYALKCTPKTKKQDTQFKIIVTDDQFTSKKVLGQFDLICHGHSGFESKGILCNQPDNVYEFSYQTKPDSFPGIKGMIQGATVAMNGLGEIARNTLDKASGIERLFASKSWVHLAAIGDATKTYGCESQYRYVAGHVQESHWNL